MLNPIEKFKRSILHLNSFLHHCIEKYVFLDEQIDPISVIRPCYKAAMHDGIYFLVLDTICVTLKVLAIWHHWAL